MRLGAEGRKLEENQEKFEKRAEEWLEKCGYLSEEYSEKEIKLVASLLWKISEVEEELGRGSVVMC